MTSHMPRMAFLHTPIITGRANHNSGQLLAAPQKALAEAEEPLMNIRTAAQLDQFVAGLVGRINVDKDGVDRTYAGRTCPGEAVGEAECSV